MTKNNQLEKAIKDSGEKGTSESWMNAFSKEKKKMKCDNLYSQWYLPRYAEGKRPKDERYKYVLD